MRVLVAGATSALGQSLLPRLIDAGHEVVGVALTPGIVTGSGAAELVADTSDRAGFLAAVDGMRADAVVSLLGAPDAFADSHRGMRLTNRQRTEGTNTLVAAARRLGATRLVASSSFEGYGLADHGDEALAETAPFAEPDGTDNDDALLALLRAEQQVRAFGGIALRFGLGYGPTPEGIPAVPARWSGLLPVVHHADAAAAVILALTGGVPGAVYNVAADEPVSWRDLQRALARAGGFPPPVVLPARGIRLLAPYSGQLITRTAMVLDTTRARTELGWAPAYPTLASALPVANTAAGVGTPA